LLSGGSMQQTKKNQGFTLIELMVTVAIMAIIAIMAAPSFNSLIMNQNLKKSTDSLIQEIRVARSKAILDKREITLNLASLSSNTNSVMNWSPEGKVKLKTASNNQLKFNGSGVLTTFGTFSVVELCKTSGTTNSKKITLTALGQIEKIEEGSCP